MSLPALLMACSLSPSAEPDATLRSPELPALAVPPPSCGPSISVPLANAAVAAADGIFAELDLVSGTFSERQLRMRHDPLACRQG